MSIEVWFGASIVCLRFLAESFCADGRGFSHRSSEASRRETLTGSSPVCIIRSKTKAKQPFHLGRSWVHQREVSKHDFWCTLNQVARSQGPSELLSIGTPGRIGTHGAVGKRLDLEPRQHRRGADRSSRLRGETNVSSRAFGPRKWMKNHTKRSRLFNGLVWFFDPEEGRPAEGCTAEPVTQRTWFSVGMFIGTSGVVRPRQCVWWAGP